VSAQWVPYHVHAHTNHQEHPCIESLAKYARNLLGRENVAKQPVFIQELSTALERALTVRISCSVKPQEDCCLCQIANKINT